MIVSSRSTLPTLHRLDRLSKDMAVTTERLASGRRIRGAGDDAAGLMISTRLKAKAGGLHKAQENIQHGLSLLQTDEAGLAIMSRALLPRLRELAVQAANGTLADNDRVHLQKEVNQIKEQIDHIANSTMYNGTKLLAPTKIESIQAGTAPPPTPKTDIVFVIDNTMTMSEEIEAVKQQVTAFTNILSNEGVDFQLGLVTYADINAPVIRPIQKYSFVTTASAFQENIAKIRYRQSGGTDAPESGLEGIESALTLPFRSDASKQIILITDQNVHESTEIAPEPKSIYTVDGVANDLLAKDITLHVVGKTDSTISSQLQGLSTPTGGTYMDIDTSFSTQLAQLATTISEDAKSQTGGVPERDPSFTLQIGTEVDDTYSVNLQDMRTHRIGVYDVDVTSEESALDAIASIDQAIEFVSAEQSKLGAHMNILENHLTLSSQYEMSVAATNERIEDADMAKEMSTLTKQRILMESAQTLLPTQQQSQNMLQKLFT